MVLNIGLGSCSTIRSALPGQESVCFKRQDTSEGHWCASQLRLQVHTTDTERCASKEHSGKCGQSSINPSDVCMRQAICMSNQTRPSCVYPSSSHGKEYEPLRGRFPRYSRAARAIVLACGRRLTRGDAQAGEAKHTVADRRGRARGAVTVSCLAHDGDVMMADVCVVRARSIAVARRATTPGGRLRPSRGGAAQHQDQGATLGPCGSLRGRRPPPGSRLRQRHHRRHNFRYHARISACLDRLLLVLVCTASSPRSPRSLSAEQPFALTAVCTSIQA